MASLADILWIAALGGLFYYMMSKGGGCCGGHDHNGHGRNEQKGHATESDQAARHQRLEEHNSPQSPVVQDPVCGMEVAKDPTSLVSEHFGRTFHFCSERCRKLFDINPGRYAGSA